MCLDCGQCEHSLFPAGVGVASLVIVIYLNIYYIVVLAWVIFYLINSFQSPLPWSTCENSWNTDSCHDRISISDNPHASNWSFLFNNTADDYFDVGNYTNRVLRMSDSMTLGNVNWDLALCLLLAWVLCYFCIWRGIKSTGKVVYFTATFPYLMLIILFFRGVSLPGAAEGLKYYLFPDMTKIFDPNLDSCLASGVKCYRQRVKLQNLPWGAGVWRDAGTQVFFSYALCQGVLTSLGSYNKYNNNCYRDCYALCCLNSGTSIFAGLVVFSVLGFMAHDLGLSVHEVAASGPGLVFIVYPKALSLLPGSTFWAVLFFFMILLLGLDTQFVCVESMATAITDLFPYTLRRPGRREILVLVIAIVCFLLGLPLVTEGGIVLFTLIDTFGVSGITLLIIASLETIVIAWVYGVDRFFYNIQDMIGYQPFPVLKYCWLFFTPAICVLTILGDLSNTTGFEVYGFVPPAWTNILKALLILTPLVCIPVFIFISLCRNPQNITTPSSDLRQAWAHKPVLTLSTIPTRQERRKEKMNISNIAKKSPVFLHIQYQHINLNLSGQPSVTQLKRKRDFHLQPLQGCED
ncbi:hypothetical protein PAMP_015067 [Pampus punctatissimus]